MVSWINRFLKFEYPIDSDSVPLDTSFLIDLMNGDEDAVEKARELETDLVRQRFSSITLFELYYGISRATDAGDVSTLDRSADFPPQRRNR
mgnify:CR=1 FL=1